MSIAHLNSIIATRGLEAGLAYAEAAQMDDWIINKLEAGEWEPGKRFAPQSDHRDLPPMRTMPVRVGKTAKSGGLAASQKRKREKAENDRQIRTRMKSASASGKGK